MIGFVYILKDDNNNFYIGSTSDLGRRLQQHKDGHTQTSRNMTNLKMVVFQEYDSLRKARKIERKLKKLKKKTTLKK